MDKYLRKHLQRESPAEKSPNRRLPQCHSNCAKGCSWQLKHISDSPPIGGKGAPNLFYCCPTDNKDGPCHAPDCDLGDACMLQL